MSIEIVNDTVVTRLEVLDNSFGEFLFENIFNEEERNMAYNTHDVAKVTALEVKADYCEGLTATSASVSNATKTIDIDLNKVLSIDGDVAIKGNLYTAKTTADDWSAATTATKVNSLDYDNTSSWINVDLSTRPTFHDVEKMITDKINENDKKNCNVIFSQKYEKYVRLCIF